MSTTIESIDKNKKRACLSFSLRSEFKPISSMVVVTIQMNRLMVSCKSQLEITENSIQLSNQHVTYVFDMANLRMYPPTCRSLHWLSPRVLQFTLQAKWMPEPSNAGDASTDHEQPFNQEHLIAKIEKCHSACYCAGCAAQIFSPTCHFARVLPLPNENWSDFADIWFCHNHTNGHGHGHSNGHSDFEPSNHRSACGENTVPENVQRVQKTGLLPKADDCLVSPLYMLVGAAQVNSNAITCTEDRLMCKRCGNQLGYVKLGEGNSTGQSLHSFLNDPLSGVYKIYFHSVTFDKEKSNAGPRMLKVPTNVPDNSREQSVEDFICGLLKDQSRMYTSFRFILQSTPYKIKGNSGIDILLWLLNQEVYLYEQTFEVPHLNGSKSDSSSQSSRPAGSQIPQRVSIKAHSIRHMKILYGADFWPADGERKTPQPKVFKDWQRDNTVHGLSLPKDLCQQVINRLLGSTKKINPYQRSFNGFNVGYLKTS